MSKGTSKLSSGLFKKFRSFYNFVNKDTDHFNMKEQSQFLAGLEKRQYILLQTMINDFDNEKLI